MKRVDSLLIGTDISATAALKISVNGVADTGATGEICVLDSTKHLLAPGSTITDSDTIYIARISRVGSFTDVNGLTRYPVVYSAPIEGRKVRTYKGVSYTAASAKVATLAATGCTPVVGDEYVLRIVYKDFQSETPAQYIKEYRVFSTSVVLQTLYNQFRAKIALDLEARFVATGTTTLIMTASAIPFASGSIDPYKIVDFEVFFNHVVPASQLPEAAGAAITYTGGFPGVGVWQQIHDMEKQAKAYRGATNYTWFPVPSVINTWDVDETKTYDLITIEHDLTYASPDNNYDKESKLVTVIAFPINCGQGNTLLATLNPWMASTPKVFAAVTI